MPRVNRDLQRRMAARRERERRRPPPEQRYRFATPEAPAEAEQGLTRANGGESAEQPVEEPRRTRQARGAATVEPAARSTRTVKPFSAYGPEYTYVVGDLRRVGLVVGSLLVILILLYLVLPH